MKTPAATEITTSARTTGRHRTTSEPFSPRERRALAAMAVGWVAREALDRAIGASNSPDVVFRLRKLLGYDAIEMRKVDAIDRDGHPCRPGQYRIAPHCVSSLQKRIGGDS